VTIVVKGMKEILVQTWDYLLDAGFATLAQLFILLGPVLILSLMMNFVARKSELLGLRVFGTKGYLYIFGWLGTSVHELGHAIFAIIFAHKVSEIKLFTPSSGKSLGHVKHSYTKGNPYQTLGNFFIGLGPVLLGSFLLFGVTWFLFGLNIFQVARKYEVVFDSGLFQSFGSLKNATINIGQGVWETFRFIITTPGSNWWKLLLFFYLFYAIGSSISLSTSDIKGAFRGFIYFAILLFLFNIATIWLGDFLSSLFAKINNYLSGFYFLIILSLGLNIAFIILLGIINFLISLLPGRNSPSKKG
jgi:hypothetical protein